MHLLLIHQNFPAQFRDLAPAWLAAGHRVTAIGTRSARPEGKHWRDLHYCCYEIREQPNPREITPPAMRARAEAVASVAAGLHHHHTPPDIVIAHSGWGEALLLRQACPTTPLIVYPELWFSPAALGLGFDQNRPLPAAALLDDELQRQVWMNLVSQLSMRQADAVVVPSRSQLNSFPASLRSGLERIAEGIDLNTLQPNPQAEVLLPNGQRVSNGDPIVTLVSRGLEPLRGLRQTLRAWPRVVAHHPGAQLILVGDDALQEYGSERPQTNSHLEDARKHLPPGPARQNLHLLGRLPHQDLVALFQCSACHIGLSYPYTLSWSLLEAMACGAPVITNHGSPLAAELTDSEQATLVPFNDTRLLSDAICALLANPAKRQHLGQAGRRLVEQTFSLKQALHAYDRLFARLKPQAVMEASRPANSDGHSPSQSP